MYASFKSALAALAGSFWFVPTLIALSLLLLALAIIAVDSLDYVFGMRDAWFFPRFGPEGARAVLTTIAGGMMTMASLVFSLTFVGLTLLAGQLGARILMFFMHDKTTQFMLGTFVGVFLFALTALGNVSELQDGFVPSLTVAAAIGLATLAFGLVIYFVHHMALSIQADVIVADLGERFCQAIARIAQTAASSDIAASRKAESLFTDLEGDPVPAPSSGYIRYIDYDALVAAARKRGLRIRLVVRPDDYVHHAGPLMYVEGSDVNIGALAKTIRMGQRRDILQEATYEARALVDVALRALSPGINDPNTAVAAINQLSAGLVALTRAAIPPNVLFDREGNPVLIRPHLGVAHYLDLVIPTLAPVLRSDTLATEAVIALLTTLHRVARDPLEIEEIERWLGVIRADISNYALPLALIEWLEKACELDSTPAP
ncbi:DUF2254 domain-containing protein [Pelagibacterium xiamenense]|uniref:DUF2254 domain-containing protein n=1 Tax=Pelagibacterium xiamenense TaxID=2901140 RepID=UPI001E51100A|nr:DUF2254 domain-containing protein [Pelagibacterium xiamenense]